MGVALIFVFLLVSSVRNTNSAPLSSLDSDDVHVSGSFRVVGDGEEIISNNQGFEETEHPFFQLEAMKIARAYLDKQYAKEKASSAAAASARA